MAEMARLPKETISSERPSPRAAEHVKAHWWRVHVAKLARPALAELLGKSTSFVTRMEEGTINGRAIEPDEYAMYRLACGAITVGVGFDWLDATIEVAPGVRISKSATPESPGTK